MNQFARLARSTGSQRASLDQDRFVTSGRSRLRDSDAVDTSTHNQHITLI
jgi:hypothetical protein